MHASGIKSAVMPRASRTATNCAVIHIDPVVHLFTFSFILHQWYFSIRDSDIAKPRIALLSSTQNRGKEAGCTYRTCKTRKNTPDARESDCAVSSPI